MQKGNMYRGGWRQHNNANRDRKKFNQRRYNNVSYLTSNLLELMNPWEELEIKYHSNKNK